MKMHYHCELVFQNRPTLPEIEEAMSPYFDNYYEPENQGEYALYDWYQIGGRWKGCHLTDYDPDKDPSNFGSDGKSLWPAARSSHDKDICHISETDDNLTCSTLIVVESKEVHTDFCSEVKPFLKQRGLNDCWLVTIDYHS